MTTNFPWLEEATEEAWELAQKELKQEAKAKEFERYQDDPVGFSEDVLGETLTDDMKRIMESVLKNPVTIAKSANSVGKTFSASRIAIHFFLTYKDAKVFLAAAPPLDNLKRLLWGELVGAVKEHKDLFEDFKKRSLYIERHPQSFIQCLTIPQTGTKKERESKFAGKHAPHLLFIVDEGDAVPDEVYDGIESCMSGGYARLLIMFNPRRKAGAVYQKEKAKRANIIQISAFDHPNVITGRNIIPGAVDRRTVIKRINEWTRPLKHDEDPERLDTFEIPDFLVGETAQADDGDEYPPLPAGTRAIMESQFAYMVLGRYPAQSASQLIDEGHIRKAQQRWKLYVAEHGEQPTGRPKMGLDVAEMGHDDNMVCLRYGGFVTRFNHYWNGIDTDATANRALSLHKQYNAEMTYVDGTGWGSSVAPSMARQGREDDVRAVSVKVASSPEDFLKIEMGEFYQLRDQLYWAVKLWLKDDDTAMLPPDPYLVEELLTIEYEVTNRGNIKITQKDKLRDKLRRSPNKADALALTFAPYERAKVLTLGE